MIICQSTRRVKGKLQVCIADHEQAKDHQWVIANPDNDLVYLEPIADPLPWIIVGVFITVLVLFVVFLLMTGTM